MITQTITTQRTILKSAKTTNSWLSPAVTQNSGDKFDVDYSILLHRVEKVIILLLPTIGATYSFFHRYLDAQSAFCLAMICCVPLPDLYFFFEIFRAERLAAAKNQSAKPIKTISITDQRGTRSWRSEHREFS